MGKLHPLLRFRKGVVCVLAANRLIRLSNQSSLCFTVHDLVGGPSCRLSVSLGNAVAIKDNISGREGFSKEIMEGNTNARKARKKGDYFNRFWDGNFEFWKVSLNGKWCIRSSRNILSHGKRLSKFEVLYLKMWKNY